MPTLNFESTLPQQISFGDTLILQFEAQDIDSYRLDVLSGSRLVASRFRPLYRDGDFFEAQIIFNDRYLESGNYDLRLSVRKGELGNSTFHSFNYQGLSLGARGMALLSNQKLYFFDDQGVLLREYPLSGSFDALKVSARDSLIYLASMGGEGIEVRDLKDFKLLQSFPAPLGANQRSFQDFVKTEQGLYLLQRDGFIKYLEGGTLRVNVDFDRPGPRYYAQYAALIDNRLAAVFAFADESAPEVHYLNENLFSLYSRALVGRSHRICALDSEVLAIIYQKPNFNWSIDRFKGQSQDYANLFDFQADSVFDLESRAQQTIVFATEEGLHLFDVSQTMAPQKIQSGKFENFQLRRTDRALFLQKGNLVQRLLLNNNLQFAASINEPLVDYEILYNK